MLEHNDHEDHECFAYEDMNDDEIKFAKHVDLVHTKYMSFMEQIVNQDDDVTLQRLESSIDTLIDILCNDPDHFIPDIIKQAFEGEV